MRVILFVLALRKTNQLRLELPKEVFDAMQAVSPRVSLLVACKERHNLCMNSASLDRESLDLEW